MTIPLLFAITSRVAAASAMYALAAGLIVWLLLRGKDV